MEGQLAEAIDALLDVEQTRLSGAELLDELREIETARRKLEALTHLRVAEIEQRGLAHEHACINTADLISQLLLIAPGEAKLRVTRAKELGPRRDLTGGPLEPIFPRVAEALRAGELCSGHVAVIVKTLDAIPAHVAHEVVPCAEAFLVEHARLLNPKQLGYAAARLLATVDPDGSAPREDEQQRRRGFSLRDRYDGTSLPGGQLTPECTTALRTVLDVLSQPIPSEDGVGDDRSAAQRRHDGLLELCQRILRSGSLPDSGGVPATIVLTMTEDELHTQRGTARTEHDTPIDLPLALVLADQADIYTVKLTATGGILDYGCSRRLASPAQRRALVARDQGCTFPGCTRPASWCQADHLVPWYLGGKTDLNNLQLLCGWHHREYQKRGWRVRMKHGIPEWLPPAWIDPEQKPIRNTAHHLPDFTFDDG